MKLFAITLRIVAPIFLVVGLIHLVFGVAAEVMLGADISDASLGDATLDSQNRFYGMAFTSYGVLLFICAKDPVRYKPVIAALLWVFLAAGMARLVSIVMVGIPSPMVLALMALELIAPPIALVWLHNVVLSPQKGDRVA
jgi:hypothetical protein